MRHISDVILAQGGGTHDSEESTTLRRVLGARGEALYRSGFAGIQSTGACSECLEVLALRVGGRKILRNQRCDVCSGVGGRRCIGQDSPESKVLACARRARRCSRSGWFWGILVSKFLCIRFCVLILQYQELDSLVPYDRPRPPTTTTTTRPRRTTTTTPGRT